VPVCLPALAVGKEEKTSFFSSKKKSEKKDLTRRKKGEDGGYALFRCGREWSLYEVELCTMDMLTHIACHTD
jgi:hypothetical protein